MKIKDRLYTAKDNFSWWIVTDIAEKIWKSESIPLYVIYDDDSESLIESEEELVEAINLNLSIGMELGFITKPKPSLWDKCERLLKNGHWYVKLSDVTKLL
ncbi:MAG: hypothetical protein ACTSPB_15370 [Candidatus Thorarchaeota archaeon]